MVGCIAALSLVAVAAPCSSVMAMEMDQPAQAMAAAPDAAAMPCDHGDKQSDKQTPKAPCHPGMACAAAFGQLPAQVRAEAPAVYKLVAVEFTSDNPLPSRPPDPSLRPPKRLSPG